MADWTKDGFGRARIEKFLVGRGGDAAHEGTEGSAGPPRSTDAEQIAKRLAAGPARGADAAEIAGISRRIVDLAQKSLEKLDGAPVSALSIEERASLEAVVHVRGRPAARVLGDELESLLSFPESDIWALLYEGHEADVMAATNATAAVRVQDKLLPDISWVQGSAVLIAPGLALTNRHVVVPINGATRIARRLPGEPGGRLKRHYKVELDFAFDDGPEREKRFEVTGIPFITADDDPVDAALLTIAATEGTPSPAPFSDIDILDIQRLYVVGHPGRLISVPEDVAMVFGTPDERKRVSFGEMMAERTVDDVHIVHDASTIGGFSGGPVIGFDGPEVMALHYWGDGVNGNRAIATRALTGHPGLGPMLVR